MNKNRIEAFTDAIIAVLITLLVLELPSPKGFTMEALFSNWRMVLVYVITFVGIVAIWLNHHNLFQK
ncbi:TMEM175 family protein [Lactobacillus terrae]|uniref:TMEM175 family protein n=1 Tax=Lactobacillus terrae TaxID=2269374 RepID=UPI000C1B76F2|nr:TMEM175 family protein [Lactobacillus terrae]